eukprot:403359877
MQNQNKNINSNSMQNANQQHHFSDNDLLVIQAYLQQQNMQQNQSQQLQIPNQHQPLHQQNLPHNTQVPQHPTANYHFPNSHDLQFQPTTSISNNQFHFNGNATIPQFLQNLMPVQQRNPQQIQAQLDQTQTSINQMNQNFSNMNVNQQRSSLHPSIMNSSSSNNIPSNSFIPSRPNLHNSNDSSGPGFQGIVSQNGAQFDSTNSNLTNSQINNQVYTDNQQQNHVIKNYATDSIHSFVCEKDIEKLDLSSLMCLMLKGYDNFAQNAIPLEITDTNNKRFQLKCSNLVKQACSFYDSLPKQLQQLFTKQNTNKLNIEEKDRSLTEYTKYYTAEEIKEAQQVKKCSNCNEALKPIDQNLQKQSKESKKQYTFQQNSIGSRQDTIGFSMGNAQGNFGQNMGVNQQNTFISDQEKRKTIQNVGLFKENLQGSIQFDSRKTMFQAPKSNGFGFMNNQPPQTQQLQGITTRGRSKTRGTSQMQQKGVAAQAQLIKSSIQQQIQPQIQSDQVYMNNSFNPNNCSGRGVDIDMQQTEEEEDEEQEEVDVEEGTLITEYYNKDNYPQNSNILTQLP